MVAETCGCFWRRGWGSTKQQLLTHLPTLDLRFFFFFLSFHKTFQSNKACSLFYEPLAAALFFQPFPGFQHSGIRALGACWGCAPSRSWCFLSSTDISIFTHLVPPTALSEEILLPAASTWPHVLWKSPFSRGEISASRPSQARPLRVAKLRQSPRGSFKPRSPWGWLLVSLALVSAH